MQAYSNTDVFEIETKRNEFLRRAFTNTRARIERAFSISNAATVDDDFSLIATIFMHFGAMIIMIYFLVRQERRFEP